MQDYSFIIEEKLESVVAKLSESQKIGLRESIKVMGCTDPILVWNNVICDGIQRYRICRELKVHFDVKHVEFSNIAEAAKERILRHQNRRQMSITNRIESALDLFEGDLAEQARANQFNGSKKGGMVKDGTDESDNEKTDKVWVNSIISELADTNPKYVSVIRTLRKKAANNDSDAKEKLFHLRRGDASISSAIKSANKKSNKKQNDDETTNKTSQNTDVEDHNTKPLNFNIDLEQMEYEKIKDHISNNRGEVINLDKVLESAAPYCQDGKSHNLVYVRC